jgi:hypothetical protein
MNSVNHLDVVFFPFYDFLISMIGASVIRAGISILTFFTHSEFFIPQT